MVSPSFVTKPYELFEWYSFPAAPSLRARSRLSDWASMRCGCCRDTYFGALMLSHDRQGSSMGLAVSSLIQITKAKTLGPQLDGHGFVPGYSKGYV